MGSDQGDLPDLHERFTLLRRLGAGGSGVVYLARDELRARRVALKTLKHLDGTRLYRFKKEFRALADVSHPNLVALYELFSDGSTWFFSMEYVGGEAFMDWVRPDLAGEPGAGDDAPADLAMGVRAAVSRPFGAEPPPDLPRLYDAFRQLAQGLQALHRGGKLHRDIKPSNALVDEDGRVKILDFGLLTDVVRDPTEMTREGTVVGTLAYMAPEQMEAEELSEASDWYSYGVILYRALTGRLPFEGRFHEILRAKRRESAVPPGELLPGLPPALSELCVDLLRADPLARPGGAEVEGRLVEASEGSLPPRARPVRSDAGASSWDSDPVGGYLSYPGTMDRTTGARHPAASGVWAPDGSDEDPGPAERPFVGRRPQLAVLRAGFEHVKDGRPSVVFVSGPAGIGKSLLVRRFVQGLGRERDLVYLSGRAYERESVPFKAFDDLIDSLARYLRRLPRSEMEVRLPRNCGPLTRLFPVLGEVRAIKEAAVGAPVVPDPIELRRRGFAALRELLGRVADRSRLILHVDDLQWGDDDSVALFGELLRPPDTPPLMLVACFRSENAEDPVVRAFRGAAHALTEEAEIFDVGLGPLAADEVVELVQSLSEVAGRGRSIAEESGGHPYFVLELVRALREGAAPGASRPELTLEGTLRWRVERLPEDARRLLEVAAVAGRPLRRQVLLRAAGVGEGDHEALMLLRRDHLARTAGTGDKTLVDVYHERVTSAVMAGLAETRRGEVHRALADALTDEGGADPEVLMVHLEGAGRHVEAGRAAVEAAVVAAEALAFGRAAELYRRALALRPASGEEARALHSALADALANAGRGAEAARVYLDAASYARGDRLAALELQRRAVAQFLFSGRLDEGLAVLRGGLLRELGLHMAGGPRAAFLSIAWHMARLRVRGLDFVERAESEVPPEDLLRIDTCRTIVIGLHLTEPLQGVDFQNKQLLLALEAGEPFRVVRALAAAAGAKAFAGKRGEREADELIATSKALADRIDHPTAQGIARYGEAFAAVALMQWQRSYDAAREAAEIFRERCRNVTADLSRANQLQTGALIYLGRIRELRARVDRLLDEARERGDRYGSTYYTSRPGPWARLAVDDPAKARRELEAEEKAWRQDGFLLQHYYFLEAHTLIDLYEGKGGEAHRRIEEIWPRVARSFVLRSQIARIELLTSRGRAALAAAAEGDARAAREAERHARACLKEGLGSAVAQGRTILAGVAYLRGSEGEAAVLLREAADDFARLGMPLHEAVCRRRLGDIVGGADGAEAVAAADALLAAEEIRRPDRFVAMLTPGLPRPEDA